MSKEQSLGVVGCALILALAFSAGFGALFMVVWNVVAVSLGAPPLGFFAAWGVWFLVSCLFGAGRAVKS